jgi:putative tryptophan/tyrosine transport system substrate-binding protein
VPVNVAFLEQFRPYGFIEGQNLVVQWLVFGKDLGLIPQYAAELVSARVDVIATAGEEATRAAQQATKTIPIVAAVDDLLGSGLVQSLARPEGNTTGVNFLAVDLDGKRQDLLIEAVPGLRRLAALADVNSTAAKLDALQEAARARDVELSIYRIARGEESGHRHGAHIGRCGAQHFCKCASMVPSSAHYRPRRRAAPADDARIS